MDFSIEQYQDLSYLSSDLIAQAGGVAHGFSTRLGGVSEGTYESLNLGFRCGDNPEHVVENFRRFRTALGVPEGRLVYANQVHGNQVHTVTTADVIELGPDSPPTVEADALLTAIPNLCLTIFWADCTPILLYDPVRKVVGAVHAGWRGTASKVAIRAIEKMEAIYGTNPEHVLASIGPAISRCCFETHEDVPNAMTESMGATALRHIEMLPTGKFLVDMKGLNCAQLELAGLDPAHITVSDHCTCCQPKRYWSHRYTNGVRGSQAAMIALL